ncbi:hypothetical protein M9458_025982 [Cirrhinus mrigala]|uniref:Reverse transcriptase domain-containing protein n=1 Tax=Cirrhinus mrigala TaxID=683832 RepID=A0ABD0PSR4_CIRMR
MNIVETLSRIRDITYNTAVEVLGFTTSKHKDWFDDQDVEVKTLLNAMHTTHLAWINDKSSVAKKSAYTRARAAAQTRLCEMKNGWWQSKAEKLQFAADRHNMKAFYHSLKAIYGPVRAGFTPVRATDGTVLSDKAEILRHWADHFQSVLNQPAAFDGSVLSEIPHWPVGSDLDDIPSQEEVACAIKQMSSGKALGLDGIPGEMLKQGGPALLAAINVVFSKIWSKEDVHQDFKDTHIIPESQCGFRAGHGTMDMVITARQIQEKCREQHHDLYMIFIDLTKTFDSVSRTGLWLILRKIGCPEKFIDLFCSFHNGIAQVLDDEELSDQFGISNGTKQGCVLAPLLFNIFFSMMLSVAFKDCDMDDCALMAHTLTEVQSLFDRFRTAAPQFGLTVSLKKTEVMLQAVNKSKSIPLVITAGDTVLTAVDKFCYLGSILAADTTVDCDISARIAKASTAFGRLSKRIWDVDGIQLDTKVAVYKAVILIVLLYGSETWTVYRQQTAKLDHFHMRCLRRITRQMAGQSFKY